MRIKEIIATPLSSSNVDAEASDPLQIEKLWNKMYQRTLMAGRRGPGINAIGAIDMVLWDLAGKYYGKPVWQLLGGAQKSRAVPYASLLPLQDPKDPELRET